MHKKKKRNWDYNKKAANNNRKALCDVNEYVSPFARKKTFSKYRGHPQIFGIMRERQRGLNCELKFKDLFSF